jgi:hypothetical protein
VFCALLLPGFYAASVIVGERAGFAVARVWVSLLLPLTDLITAAHPLLDSISDTLVQHGAVRRRNLGTHVLALNWAFLLLMLAPVWVRRISEGKLGSVAAPPPVTTLGQRLSLIFFALPM